jgi:hypothetical protein
MVLDQVMYMCLGLLVKKHVQMLMTSFLNALGFQSRATSRVYPPWPSRPGSPGGFGISPFTSGDESDANDSEVSDTDDLELESSSSSEVAVTLGLGDEALPVSDENWT